MVIKLKDMKNIPLELEEAAYVDGAKQWTVFWKIIFPLLSRCMQQLE